MNGAGAAEEEEQREGTPGLVKRGPSALRRLLWLLAVCFVAFAYPLINSTLYFLFSQGVRPRSFTPGQLSFWFYFAIVLDLIVLLFLFYALRRQGRSFRDLGFSFSWKDVPESLLLAIGSYVIFVMVYMLFFYIHYFLTGRALNAEPQNVEFVKAKITLAAVLLMVVNPFYEELLARAYVMTEVEALTKSPLVAICVSVGLQSAYHLYQGIVSAALLSVLFMVFSVYFVLRRKILPVILAHMYFDLLALLSNAQY